MFDFAASVVIQAMRYSARAVGVLFVALLTSLWVGCGDHPSAPTPTPPPAPPSAPPAPTPTRLAITGNPQIARIGDTSQLTATVTLSDNTTKDVTGSAMWTVGDPRVVNVSTTGLMTGMQFGSTYVLAQYQSRGATLTVTVTPQGTFAISGRVREPGRGGFPNARVLDTISGRVATTNSDGDFSIGELPALHAHFKVEESGFEPAEVDATRPNVDIPVQQVVRLTAGETVKPHDLAPNDLTYTVGTNQCNDCRLIRVIVPQAGNVHVHVTWTVAASKLNLFVEGQVVEGGVGDLTADVPVDAPREVLMYLGTMPPTSVNSHTPFVFETSLR
jgi:carboxypeptidase family protein/Big-like domain-containing protein